MGYSWLRLKWFVLGAYLLLWVPWAMFLSRRSYQPEILGRWSPRSFAFLVAATLVLAVATWGVWRTCVGRSRFSDLLDEAVRGIRSSPWRWWLALGIVPISWLVPVLYLARLATPLSATVLVSLAATAGMVVVLESALLLAERPCDEQRDRLMKLGLLSVSVIVSLVGVEIWGRSAGRHQSVWWNINPPGLNVRFRTEAFDVPVVTNCQGLREPATVPLAASGERRVVVVGDSVTFGWGVSQEATFSHVCERELRNRYGLDHVRVINMGRPGANLRDYLCYIRRYAVQFQPRVIVVAFLLGNDCPVVPPARLRSEADFRRELSEHIAASAAPAAERWLAGSFVASALYAGVYRVMGGAWGQAGQGVRGPLFGEPNPLDPQRVLQDIEQAPDPQRSKKIYARLRRDGWIDRGLQWKVNPWLVHAALLHPDGPADSLVTRAATRPAMQQEWRLCEALLLECRAAAAEAHAELMILAIPPGQAVSLRSLKFLEQLGCAVHDEMLRTRTVNDWMAAFAARSGLVCLDPTDQMREAERRGESLYFATDDHLTAEGHRFLGETLAAGLAARLAGSAEPGK